MHRGRKSRCLLHSIHIQTTRSEPLMNRLSGLPHAALFRILQTAVLIAATLQLAAQDSQTRTAADSATQEAWLKNMAWHHFFTPAEMQQVTGLSAGELQSQLQQLGPRPDTSRIRPQDRVHVLPYPGGRHPRIGFLDGAVDPQRETKLSVFAPWDDRSYAVLDVPEAVWSNLGLTYLAHTHVDTLWTKQNLQLPQQEWEINPDGSLQMERKLPNGIVFGTKVIPRNDHLRMKMWLTNGTDKTLTDLRVQNCVMLKGMQGFDQQTNENKQFTDGYAVVGSPDKQHWIITAWTPLHRGWGNAPCPCLHSDPVFPDCPPGETRFLRGWFSFFAGEDLQSELDRIEATGWRQHPLHHVTGNVTGQVLDSVSGKPLPCRLYVHNKDSDTWHFARSTAVAGSAVEYRKRVGKTQSIEHHVTLSADPFQLDLPPGRYTIRAEYGKEYVPQETEIEVSEQGPRQKITLQLQRMISMNSRGWYSGDTHIHRQLEDLPNLILAEDVNVALPLTHWVRDSSEVPAASGPEQAPELIAVDDSHVIWPVNTEYEIFSINRRRQTQGAVFVLNHRQPLTQPAPPVSPVTTAARQQGALLDLDKHSWAWSMMIIPLMQVDLFELSNNHNWRTEFGFPQWTLENAPDWPEIERSERGFTELGWTEFGMQTYYAVLNCGYRMRVTAGTGAGVHPVPLGHGRVYVHTGQQFSYEGWIAGLNRGNSFATTGPLADLRFNKELPGTTWTTDQSQNTVQVQGMIWSRHRLKSIEVIHNGRIVQQQQPAMTPANGGYQCSVDLGLTFSGSGWVAVRGFEDLPDQRVSFFHTNPVFVDVNEMPVQPRRRDAEFFVQRMDEELRRNEAVLSDEALAEYSAARKIWAEHLKRATD